MSTEAATTTETTTTETSTAPESGVVETSQDAGGDSDADFYAKAKAAAAKTLSAEKEARIEAELGEKPVATGLAAEAEKKADAPKSALEDDEPRLAKLLRAREQGQKERQEAESHAARVRQQAEAAANDLLSRARAQVDQMLREAEAGGRRKLDEMMSPEAIMARQADEQDPVHRMGKRFESELAKRDAALEEMRAKLSEGEQRWQQRAAQEAEHQKTQAEKAFLTNAAAEKFPYMRAMWDDGEILREAHSVIQQVKDAAAERGERFACTDDEIMQYLEKQARTRLTAKRDSLTRLLQQVEAPKEGKPSQVNGHGPRTLSTQHASERRASPKALDDMTEAEIDRAMRAAARKRLRSAE